MLIFTCVLLSVITLTCYARAIYNCCQNNSMIQPMIGVVIFHVFLTLAARRYAMQNDIPLNAQIDGLAISCVLLYLSALVIWLAYDGKFEDWYYAVVVGIGRQRSLYRILLDKRYVPPEAVEKAMTKLVQQDLLARLADASRSREIQLWAMNQLEDKALSDQLLLRFVSSEAEPQGFRTGNILLEAAGSIASHVLAQSAYTIIAQNEKAHKDIRSGAAKMLDDAGLAQSIFAELEAVDLLTDQVLLFMVASQTKSKRIRLAAADKLDNEAQKQTAYEKIALESVGWESELGPMVRFEVTGKLANQQIAQQVYHEIAFDQKINNDLRKQAAMCLASKAEKQEAAYCILQELRFYSGHYNSIKEPDQLFGLIFDESLLQDLTLHGESSDVRQAAAGRITNQSILLMIVHGEAEIQCKALAINRIQDQATLLSIAQENNDFQCRKAAADRLADQRQQQRIYFDLAPHFPDLCKAFGGHFLVNKGVECTDGGGGMDVYYNTSWWAKYEYKCVCLVCGYVEYYPCYSESGENDVITTSERSAPPVLPNYESVERKQIPHKQRFPLLMAIKTACPKGLT